VRIGNKVLAVNKRGEIINEEFVEKKVIKKKLPKNISRRERRFLGLPKVR
jgi:hypothetical protein